MKKIVITGASGFIGKATMRSILEKYSSAVVYAIVRNKSLLMDFVQQGHQVEIIECDYQNYNKLSKLINGPIDVFIHFAWTGVSGNQSRSIAVQSMNISAACVIMEQAIALKTKKFIFAGSSYQYRLEPYLENGKEKYGYRNIYGMAKLSTSNLLQVYAQNNEIEYNCILFTNVYGVGDCSERSTNTFIRKLLRKENLQLISGEHKHDWTYIDDAVNGIIAVIERGKNSVEYYIGSRSLQTFEEIISEVRDLIYPKAVLDFGAYTDKGYIDYSKIDLNRLYYDTGFECKSNFEFNIQKTVDWIKSLDDYSKDN